MLKNTRGGEGNGVLAADGKDEWLSLIVRNKSRKLSWPTSDGYFETMIRG
jgi:hypothetical protein